MYSADPYGLRLSTSPAAAAAYTEGLLDVLRLRTGAVDHFAEAIAHDPAFALGHAALALLGHEMGAPVDVAARISRARVHAGRACDRERSHIYALTCYLEGETGPLLRHVREYPGDALLLSIAVPTIAFAGATEVPEQAWAIVEGAAPAYGDDWWYAGLLAFMRQEQCRFDEAMSLSCASLAVEPGAGHSAHARAHAHYETGDHEAGLAWMSEWVVADGARTESLSHFAWHAAMHELSLGDLDAVRRRYRSQLDPHGAVGCRALVDGGSLLFRWALTPEACDVPDFGEILAATRPGTLEQPATPFLAMHAATARLACGDADALDELARWASMHEHPTFREVVAPLGEALASMARGGCSEAADRLARLAPQVWRLGGSDAQREIVEEARIAALLRAERWDEARTVLDARLDRRRSPRDARWRATVSS
ncbi:tetratricopeptide repeat protein [Nocardioides ultimimeridianus]